MEPHGTTAIIRIRVLAVDFTSGIVHSCAHWIAIGTTIASNAIAVVDVLLKWAPLSSSDQTCSSAGRIILSKQRFPVEMLGLNFQ